MNRMNAILLNHLMHWSKGKKRQCVSTLHKLALTLLVSSASFKRFFFCAQNHQESIEINYRHKIVSSKKQFCSRWLARLFWGVNFVPKDVQEKSDGSVDMTRIPLKMKKGFDLHSLKISTISNRPK